MTEGQLDPGLVTRLHRKANADRWGLTVDRFASALESSVARAFKGQPPPSRDVERYIASLHLEDLALASACADGSEGAWEHFIRELRPVLYRAADAVDPSGAAREIADSLYGELFGLSERQGERLSLFRYFHGRSSLATWLRAVLSQRHVDRLRRTRRLDPLPSEEGAAAIAAKAEPVSLERTRFVNVMQRAITAAIQRLPPRDRLRLACYYAEALTLAQIARTLGEHEATCSRHLARIRREIRRDVEQQLRRSGMSDTELTECFACVSTDAGPLNLAEMLAGRERKKSEPDRSP